MRPSLKLNDQKFKYTNYKVPLKHILDLGVEFGVP